jgi:hypothetical protein
MTADGIVNDNLLLNFASAVQSPEARCFNGLQKCSCRDLLSANRNIDLSFRLSKHSPVFDVKPTGPFPGATQPPVPTASECLLMFGPVEGIFFSGAFSTILWLKQCGILPGLCFSNHRQLISPDEPTQSSCLPDSPYLHMYNHL